MWQWECASLSINPQIQKIKRLIHKYRNNTQMIYPQIQKQQIQKHTNNNPHHHHDQREWQMWKGFQPITINPQSNAIQCQCRRGRGGNWSSILHPPTSHSSHLILYLLSTSTLNWYNFALPSTHPLYSENVSMYRNVLSVGTKSSDFYFEVWTAIILHRLSPV